MDIAILGAGRMGRTHGTALARVDGVRLAAVFDPVEEAATAMERDFGCRVMALNEIAADTSIDAVIICTPTDTHADFIEQFARAGKAVFCEKPIDLDIARVRRCIDVADAAQAPLMIGFNRRFDPDFAALKARVDAGDIGAIESVTIISRDPSAPPYDYITRSGGIFRDMTIHDFDIARWILGSEPITGVTARGSVLTDPKIGELGDYDSVSILMTTDSGKQVNIQNSRRATYGYDQRVEVFGSKGMVQVANAHEDRVTIASSGGYRQPPLMDFFMTRYARAYELEMIAFAEAVKAGRPLPVTGHDGLEAMRLADAALLSAREGRLVAP